MPTNPVNLDALIRREDFETTFEEMATEPSNLGSTMRIADLGPDSLWYRVLRKPDFQRETANWSPQRITELVSSFLEGDLIPAVILWRSPVSGNLFVIDGAHRVSALIAWVHDDYGDQAISREFFDHNIPQDQLKAATETRALINEHIGSYEELSLALRNPEKALKKEHVALARNMSVFAASLQWVGGGAEKAETSFFKINQQAVHINNTELDMIKARRKPNALAARAFIRAGTGHKYWSTFDDAAKAEIEALAKDVYDLIFKPEIDSQIRTSDLPVAGRSYSADAIQMVFELVNFVNGLEPPSSRRRNSAREALPDDENGRATINFMRKVKRATNRIVGRDPASLGLHPAVYFYSATGRFQPAAFLAAIAFTGKLEESRALGKFTNVRSDFEEFLVSYPYFVNQIVQSFGSFMRSVPTILSMYDTIFVDLLEGKSQDEIFDHLTSERSYLTAVTDEDKHHRRNFSANYKSATYLKGILDGAPSCGICHARLNLKSVTVDHIRRRQDGGTDAPTNTQLTHPYCNSGYKESLHAAQLRN